jgi:hypothetical protein
LPVMVTPTPISALPAYLKAVTILEPTGNTAAEVSAVASKLLRSNAGLIRRRLWYLVVLGLFSGLISFFGMTFLDQVSFSFLASGGMRAPLLPWITFGLALTVCAWIFGTRDKFHLAVIVAFTVIAWTAAVDVGSQTADLLYRYTRTVPPVSQQELDQSPPGDQGNEKRAWFPGTEIIIGFVAGSIGGALTFVGLLIGMPWLRKVEYAALTITVAALTGGISIIMPFIMMGILPRPLDGYVGAFVFFALWQTSFIATLVRARLASRQED